MRYRLFLTQIPPEDQAVLTKELPRVVDRGLLKTAFARGRPPDGPLAVGRHIKSIRRAATMIEQCGGAVRIHDEPTLLERLGDRLPAFLRAPTEPDEDEWVRRHIDAPKPLGDPSRISVKAIAAGIFITIALGLAWSSWMLISVVDRRANVVEGTTRSTEPADSSGSASSPSPPATSLAATPAAESSPPASAVPGSAASPSAEPSAIPQPEDKDSPPEFALAELWAWLVKELPFAAMFLAGSISAWVAMHGVRWGKTVRFRAHPPPTFRHLVWIAVSSAALGSLAATAIVASRRSSAPVAASAARTAPPAPTPPRTRDPAAARRRASGWARALPGVKRAHLPGDADVGENPMLVASAVPSAIPAADAGTRERPGADSGPPPQSRRHQDQPFLALMQRLRQRRRALLMLADAGVGVLGALREVTDAARMPTAANPSATPTSTPTSTSTPTPTSTSTSTSTSTPTPTPTPTDPNAAAPSPHDAPGASPPTATEPVRTPLRSGLLAWIGNHRLACAYLMGFASALALMAIAFSREWLRGER